jgi:predicted enzyme related to lactoylglutathione lyase
VTVLRIVANFKTDDPGETARFYEELFGLGRAMDMGWIVTLTSDANMIPQLSLMREGGSGTNVPDISVEVDDVDSAHARAKKAGFDIVYPLADEPWGVRRFYVRDPQGRTINILSHISK